MTLKTVVDWVTDTNSFFLLGAGCSLCAKKPLIDDLTKIVATTVSDAGKKLLEDLVGTNNRPATVEDLISHLLQLEKLLSTRKNFGECGWTVESIRKEVVKIQGAILNALGSEWEHSDSHGKFLRRLGAQKRRSTLDVFLLNYDTVLEATLEALQYHYTDGFRGSENAYFDAGLYDSESIEGILFRIYKLHGSINWVRDSNGYVRRRPVKSLGESPRVVVYPAEQKYLQTQFGVYETLLGLFRRRMRESRPNNNLIVMGYSFNDEHINHAIEDSVRTEGSNTTLYAFIGPEKDVAAQCNRLKETANRCDHRFNAIVGNEAFIGPALTEIEWNEVKAKELWKFENLASLLAGGK